MRIWRWNLTIERVPRYHKPVPGPRGIETWLLEHYDWPDNCVVRNQRTGETCLVRPPQAPHDLIRGMGSVAPCAILQTDQWTLVGIEPLGLGGPRMVTANG